MKIYNEIILQWNDESNQFETLFEDYYDHYGEIYKLMPDQGPIIQFCEDDGDCDWGFICVNPPGGFCDQDPHMVNLTISSFDINGADNGNGLLTIHVDTGLAIAGFQMDFEMGNLKLGPNAGNVYGGLAAIVYFNSEYNETILKNWSQ